MNHSTTTPVRALLLLVCLVAACNSPSTHEADERSATTISVDTAPSLVIPSMATDDSVNFGSVRSIALLGDGRIAVLDGTTRTIRLFAPDGRQLIEFGRQGAGPGEFKYPLWLGECLPDTLAVIDPSLGRLSLFDTEGRFARSHEHTRGEVASNCDQSGRIVELHALSGGEMPSADSPLYEGTITRTDIGSATAVLDTLPLYYNRPMGRVTYIAVANRLLFVGRADSAFVEKRSMDGEPITRFPLGQMGIAPTRAQYSAEIEVMLRMLSNPEDRARPREILLKVPAPATMPAFRALFTDPTGAAWAVTSPAGEPVTVLEGIDSLGKRFAPVRLSGDLTVHAVGRDKILAVAEDADGTQTILMFRLTRR